LISIEIQDMIIVESLLKTALSKLTQYPIYCFWLNQSEQGVAGSGIII
jgi:hypothetical protein